MKRPNIPKPPKQGKHSDEDYQAMLRSHTYRHMTKKEATFWRDIKRKYNLTPDQYFKIYDKQHGLCASCKQTMKKPSVDHCHTTGKIRGILCHNCNIALGLLKDNPSYVQGLLRYIKKNQ